MISASQLLRSLACPGSCVLPKVKSISPAADKGIAIHKYLETGVIPKGYEDECVKIDTDSLPSPEKQEHEVAMAYDVATGFVRRLKEPSPREYGELGPYEIPGTADLVGFDSGIPYVADYKTGQPVTPCKDNPQLRFLAMCWAYLNGSTRCIAEIVYVRDSVITRDTCVFDSFDWGVFDQELKRLQTQVQTERERRSKNLPVHVTEGNHCTYCPAFVHCPAKKNLALALARGDGLPKSPASLTRTDAALAYYQIRAVRALLNKVERVIFAMADQEPLQGKNGKLIGPVISNGREYLDAKITSQVLSEVVNDECASDAMNHNVTKTSIRQALKAANVNVTKTMREVESEVRSRGGSEQRKTKRIEEY